MDNYLELKESYRSYEEGVHYSIRLYKFGNNSYQLGKIIDSKRYFLFCNIDGRLEIIPVDNKDIWGRGLSWSKAEAKVLEALNGQR